MLNIRKNYSVLIALFLLSSTVISHASEKDLDQQTANNIKHLIGASNTDGILLLSFGKTGSITTYTTPEMTSTAGNSSGDLTEIVPISFVISGPGTTVNATIGELSLQQTLPVSDLTTSNPTINASNLTNLGSQVISTIKDLASISDKHPLLILSMTPNGINVYKSEVEFNNEGVTGQMSNIISGTVISSETSLSSGLTTEDGCITYYYTIGGVTYVYVYCP